MNTNNILKTLLFFIAITNTYAQDLISYEKIKSMTKEEISSSYSIQAKYDVDVYRIEYLTKNISMNKDTASGIISVAVDIKSTFPILLYDHGTVEDRYDVPSEGSSEQFLSIILASLGYHCVAPDYIGLGISKGIHPYIHPESEAWAGIDLIYAVKNLEEIESIHFNNQLFVTGYSQGGHAALATCRALEDIDNLVLTAAAPMSGPYSVSKEMKLATMGEKEYFFCAYLGSVILSMQNAYPDLLSGYEIEDIFKPEFASLVRKFESEQIDLFNMNNQMIALLSTNGGKILPKNMFIDSIGLKILNDQNFPINLALQRMDVCNWIPTSPIKLLYCTADDQVTFRNAVYTDSLMNAMGAENVSSKDVLSSGDHGSCVSPAVLNMLVFFNQYQEIGSVSTKDQEQEAINIWPNPTDKSLTISPISYSNTIAIIKNTNGETLLQFELKPNTSNSINVSNLKAGLIFLQLISENGIITTKKVIITE